MLLLRSTLKSFEIGNDVRSLPGVEPKLRHVHVAGANPLNQCLLKTFDRISPMQLTEWWCDLERARAQFVGCVAGAAIGSDEGLSALLQTSFILLRQPAYSGQDHQWNANRTIMLPPLRPWRR